MHLDLPHLVYPGAPLDDLGMLDRLPGELAAALRARNGCVAFQGGLHVRGATRAPVWHSLRDAWEGSDALHRLFPEVRTDDVPFAEDAFGGQVLLREGCVIRLSGELGELSVVADSLESFFSRLLADPEEMLDYAPLLRFLSDGGRLEPGQLLAAYPPFALEAEGAQRELRPADALERRRLLAELASRLHGLPDGTEVRLERDA